MDISLDPFGDAGVMYVFDDDVLTTRDDFGLVDEQRTRFAPGGDAEGGR